MKNYKRHKYLNEHEVAELTGIKVGTLRNWRYRGVGPPFLKIGHLVRYDLVDVEAFMESSKVKTVNSQQ